MPPQEIMIIDSKNNFECFKLPNDFDISLPSHRSRYQIFLRSNAIDLKSSPMALRAGKNPLIPFRKNY